MAAAFAGQLPAAALLLSRGAAVDAATRDGDTALMCAAAQGDAPMAACLLAAGADVRAANAVRLLCAARRCGCVFR